MTQINVSPRHPVNVLVPLPPSDAGVRKIQTGKVVVLDGDMADEKHRSASYGRVAYMPQGLGRNLHPTLSVFDNIDFFGRLFGQGAAERAGASTSC